jgi:integrase
MRQSEDDMNVRGVGDERIRNISRGQLQDLLNATAKESGRSMVDHLRFRLRSIFEMAVSEGAVDRNPATTRYTPRHCRPGRERRVMDANQILNAAAVLDIRERVIFRLATWEGMRPGEILALQLGDFEGDSIWIRRRLYRGRTGDPKTKRSARQVALTTGTKLLLNRSTGHLPPMPMTGCFRPKVGSQSPGIMFGSGTCFRS